MLESLRPEAEIGGRLMDIPEIRRMGKSGRRIGGAADAPNNPTVEPQKLKALMRRTESTVIAPSP